MGESCMWLGEGKGEGESPGCQQSLHTAMWSPATSLKGPSADLTPARTANMEKGDGQRGLHARGARNVSSGGCGSGKCSRTVADDSIVLAQVTPWTRPAHEGTA